jgi:hypothetical protein
MSRCQESNILELAKPNLLHFSEATNEITPSASVSWRSENMGCQTQPTKNLHPARVAKRTQQRVIFSNACDFSVRVTGAPVELGGVPQFL